MQKGREISLVNLHRHIFRGPQRVMNVSVIQQLNRELFIDSAACYVRDARPSLKQLYNGVQRKLGQTINLCWYEENYSVCLTNIIFI